MHIAIPPGFTGEPPVQVPSSHVQTVPKRRAPRAARCRTLPATSGGVLRPLIAGGKSIATMFDFHSFFRPAAAISMAVLALPGIAHSFGRLDARNGDECRAQVNANYDALEAEMRASGNLRGIDAMNRRGRATDLADCDRMDRQAQDATMSRAFRRLSQALRSLQAGSAIPADEKRALAADHEAIVGFPPAPFRDAYLALHAEFMRYDAVVPAPPAAAATRMYRCTDAGGRVEFSQRPCEAGATQAEMAVRPQATGTSASWSQCRDFKARIAGSRKEHDDAVAALAGPRPAGGVDDAGGWRELNARRVAALSEMNWQRFQARSAGCAAD
jgi:uncharacterized protein DUF4124